MCWQSITLKDPSSQELLEAVEREKSIRFTPSRPATIFRHPTLGDFELPHLPVGINEAELQVRIIQHFAAADAMNRIARREGSRRRSSAPARPQYLVFSGHHSGSSAGHGGEETEPFAATESNPSVPIMSVNNIRTRRTPSPIDSIQNSASSSSPPVMTISGPGFLNDNRNDVSQDRAGPSESQSFSDSWRSRFSSMSTKYKESISKSTKEWKEKLFSMSDIGCEVKREVNAGVSRLMERLESNISGRGHVRVHVPVVSSAESSSNSSSSRDTPSDSH